MSYNNSMNRTSLAIGTDKPVLSAKTGLLPWGLAFLSILISFAAIGITVWGVVTSGDYRSVLSHQTLTPFITIAFAVIGALIASRHPRNPIGWIFTVVGLLEATTALTAAFTLYGSSASALYSLAAWLDYWVWLPASILPFTFVLLLFPNGKLLTPRWRLISWCAALGTAITTLSTMMQSESKIPLTLEPNLASILTSSVFLDLLAYLGAGLLAVGLIGSFVSLFLRFHRSKGIEREQMKWVVYALGLSLFIIPLGSAAWAIWPESPLVNEISIAATGLAILGIAVAAAIGILRHRLYDIDVIINRTMVYTALTIGVAILYVVIVGGLGTFFQIRGNLVLSLVATGLAAILVQPMRDSLQRFVNRLMYGERDDPYAVLTGLSQRLEGFLSPEAILPAVVETVAQALKLPYVAIALLQGGELSVVASYGLVGSDWLQLPLIYQGETIGQLRFSHRSPTEVFTTGEEHLLRDIARHIGVTAHTVRLTQDLRTLAKDLQRSREELVIGREEERRRLRRDLHDELGPQLASLKLNLDVARNLITRDPDAAEDLLVQLRTQSQSAIADIRRLVYDLRPPALDELGLIGAIQEFSRQIDHKEGLQIKVSNPKVLPPLPAAVEVAAYRISLEAMTNFVRHSQGSTCQVAISHSDQLLQVEVSDDGQGFPRDKKAGVGLTSMRERAAELGGTCEIESHSPGGTSIIARLPLRLGGD